MSGLMQTREATLGRIGGALTEKWPAALTVFGVSVLIQLLFIAAMPLTSTLDSSVYARILMGADVASPPDYPTFFAVSKLGELIAPDSLLGLQILQSLFGALSPLLLFLAVWPASRIGAALAAALFILSFNPFFYSTWLMLEHLYLFGLVLLLWAYSAFFYGPRALTAVGLGLALAFAFHARSNGIVLPGVVLIALGLSLAIRADLRTLAFLKQAGIAAAAFVVGALALFLAALPPGYAPGDNASVSQTPRFLFCNIYGHADEGGRRAQLTGETAAPIRDVLRQSQERSPDAFQANAQRWPELFTPFAGDPDALVAAFVENTNGGPGMRSSNHVYCWYILGVMDAALGPEETNRILTRQWVHWLFVEGVGWRHYLTSTFEFFFQHPDNAYYGNTIGPPALNASATTPRMYAQLAFIPRGDAARAVAESANKYWLWFILHVTPWISLGAGLAALTLLDRRYAPLTLFLLGVATSQGLLNAVTNTTDARYVAMAYPAMCGLFGLLLGKTPWAAAHIRQRLRR